ncbi:MAG: SDR family oxidoreductase [Actinomycetota bacterium]
MRILITGGAGYIGFSLVRALASRDDVRSIRVIDNLSRRNHALFVSGSHGKVPVEFRRVDLLDGQLLEQMVRDVDVVIHLAARATTPQSDLDHHVFDQVNNWGTSQLARTLSASPAHTVVYVSSFAVYGEHDEPVTEATTPAPASSYGVSKMAGEAHLRRLATSDRRVHVVRAGNVFGFNPAIRFDTVINAMCFDAWTERTVRIHGDGTQTRPFIAVDTLAETLAELVASDQGSGLWNLASHNASVLDLVSILQELVPRLEYMHLHRDMRMQRITMDVPSTLLAQLGVESAPLKDSMARLIKALEG